MGFAFMTLSTAIGNELLLPSRQYGISEFNFQLSKVKYQISRRLYIYVVDNETSRLHSFCQSVGPQVALEG